MTSPHHPNGSQPRPIGKYTSVSEAARKLGITRQEAKRILDPKPKEKPQWRQDRTF
jgi:hypothetical protein